MSDAVLEITGLTISYGQVRAVADIHLSVLSGRITTLIGSNGAGKTTIMKGVTGLKQVASGGVRFRGEQLIGRQVDADRRSRRFSGAGGPPPVPHHERARKPGDRRLST